MPIVTLLSDWGLKDHYLAAVKAKIYKEACFVSNLNIVDISHLVQTYNIKEAAYIFKNAFGYFPKGTIHCIGVNDIASETRSHLVVSYQGQYIICCNNGFLEAAFDKMPEFSAKILLPGDGATNLFPSLDLFPLVAAHILRGGNILEIAEEYTLDPKLFKLKPQAAIMPLDANRLKIEGSIIYIDGYGNAVSNITREVFDDCKQKYSSYQIFTENCRPIDICKSISLTYKTNENKDELPKTQAVFLENRLLEVSLTNASAAQLYGLEIGSKIIIYFNK